MPADWTLDDDRCFSPVPTVRERARALYDHVRELPLVCPHGHVPPELLADPDAAFGDPASLFVTPDHYVFRMLYADGVPLEALGVPSRDGTPVETDARAIWRRFCERFHLFRGTPTGLWLKAELIELFGIDRKPSAETADALFDQLSETLATPALRPRALLERFGIEALATTDAADDDLAVHERMRADGLPVRPTFRPDALLAIDAPDWRERLAALESRAGRAVDDLDDFLEALRERREAFRQRGATASDHGATSAWIEPMPAREAQETFARARAGRADAGDAHRFASHLLYEMAGMARDDGLVMQLHVGSLRNHHARLYERFGPDAGADIPLAVDWTRGLHTLLNAHGHDPAFRLIVYTLDEATYGRELAPLAGHYPALRLGSPWWFFDSVLGMERYLDRVVETAGVYALAGFVDDTRAFVSIPARHDVWRRTTASWLAGQVERGLIDEDDAAEMAVWLAYGAAKAAFRLP